jgi:hypothetical protein
MEFVNYLLISVLTYLGLGAGLLISWMAEEELKPGRKYFVLAHILTLTFILFFILESFNLSLYIVLLLPLLLIIFLFRYIYTYKKSQIMYILLGIISYLALPNKSYFFIIMSLIFFYGMILSALELDIHKKNYFSIILKNLGFFICVALFFL